MSLKKRSNVIVKRFSTNRNTLEQGHPNSSTHCWKVIIKVILKFSQSQIPRSQEKVLSIENAYKKHQSSNTHCSNVISEVKVSDRITEWQNDRQDKKYAPIFDIGGMKNNFSCL